MLNLCEKIALFQNYENMARMSVSYHCLLLCLKYCSVSFIKWATLLFGTRDTEKSSFFFFFFFLSEPFYSIRGIQIIVSVMQMLQVVKNTFLHAKIYFNPDKKKINHKLPTFPRKVIVWVEM